MRAVVQRVFSGAVTVDGEKVSEIGNGLLILLGVGNGDTEADVDFMLRKLPNMRIFSDENDKMNLSVKDIKGEILLVSQFTLYGDARKGNRPSFIEAMEPEKANALFERLFSGLSAIEEISAVKKGVFGANMRISMEGNGPVTILLDSRS